MRYLALTSLVGALACAPDIDVDEGEGVSPIIEFDPGNRIIPFPNNLLLDPTDGTVNLPEQCNESDTQTALRELVLNQLDGFGTFKPALVITTSTEVDPASVEGNAFLFQRAAAGEPVDPAEAQAVPLVAVPTVSVRNSADCSETSLVPALALVPAIPLQPQSTYTVALTSGITSSDGEAFAPSTTWALVRLADNPVTVENGAIVAEKTPLDPVADAEQLLGLNLLWNAHNPALEFIDQVVEGQRGDILAAWDFNTQTTVAPLDPAVADSPASEIPAAPLTGVASIVPGGATPADVINGATGNACLAGLPCDDVGDILIATLSANNYQIQQTNPIGGDELQGPWADPVNPPMVRTEDITALVFVPGAAPPAGGYQTVIFGHGLTRSRNDLFAIGSQLAQAGILSVAINWVAHGDRAVQTSNDAALGCSGTVDPSEAPQCFAPIISADLATTRDSLRQSALDVLSLIEALKACDGDASCGDIAEVNPEKLGYIGQSLGAIIGAVVVAMGADIEAAVLNVGGVGLLDIVENTDTAGIKCPLVDALIAAGVVQGTPGETCLTDDWKTQPGYRSFASIARWVLDPSDGANYLSRWGARPILIQKVVDDQVVPNIVTDQMAALRGLSAQMADTAVPGDTVSEAITTDPNVPKFVEYADVPGDGDTFPGNTYSHGSLLDPGTTGDTQLATAMLQTDAITFLLQNLL